MIKFTVISIKEQRLLSLTSYKHLPFASVYLIMAIFFIEESLLTHFVPMFPFISMFSFASITLTCLIVGGGGGGGVVKGLVSKYFEKHSITNISYNFIICCRILQCMKTNGVQFLSVLSFQLYVLKFCYQQYFISCTANMYLFIETIEKGERYV